MVLYRVLFYFAYFWWVKEPYWTFAHACSTSYWTLAGTPSWTKLIVLRRQAPSTSFQCETNSLMTNLDTQPRLIHSGTLSAPFRTLSGTLSWTHIFFFATDRHHARRFRVKRTRWWRIWTQNHGLPTLEHSPPLSEHWTNRYSCRSLFSYIPCFCVDPCPTVASWRVYKRLCWPETRAIPSREPRFLPWPSLRDSRLSIVVNSVGRLVSYGRSRLFISLRRTVLLGGAACVARYYLAVSIVKAARNYYLFNVFNVFFVSSMQQTSPQIGLRFSATQRTRRNFLPLLRSWQIISR